ncbi:MAG: DUF6056 family protein [Faecousia sp.]
MAAIVVKRSSQLIRCIKISSQGGIVLKIIQENRRYILCFFILFCLCWLFPYTGDDWAWGSSIGLERLNKWFDNYNGRYVGNLIVLALTRSNLLKSISMSACLTGILYIFQQLTKANYSFTFGALLLFAAPGSLLGQSVVWTSGFANYAVSAFTALIYILYIYWIFDEREQTKPEKLKQHPLQGLAMIILGLVNTLIVEHVTVYNLFLSIFVVGYVLFKYRRILIQQVCYLIGSVLGTVCMFSNTAYATIASDSDYYRSIALSKMGILRRFFFNYFDVIYEHFYLLNLVLNGAILAVCIWIFYLLSKERKAPKWYFPVMRFSIGINIAYWVYSVISVIGLSSCAKLTGLKYFEGIFTAISGLFLILFIILSAIQYKKLHKILFLIGSILLVVVPLVAVTPVSSRCFFASYVLFILLFLELCSFLPLDNIQPEKIKMAMKIGQIGIVAALLFYFSIFSAIYRTGIQNQAHIQQEIEKGAQTIEILNYPYGSYLHLYIPDEASNLAMRYKLFYGYPDEIYLISVDEYGNVLSE